MSTTRMTRLIRAPRAAVYRALVDPAAVQAWMVPDGMTSEVHAFDARVGGAFRISLTYEGEGSGKTSAGTDTYSGHFFSLVPGQEVVETMAFETDDPAMQGEMRVTFRLANARGGTELQAEHARVPPGIAPEDNETGWRMALDKLAALAEAEAVGARTGEAR